MTTASTGTGPVDAAYVAVTKALGIENIKLLEFAVSRSVRCPVPLSFVWLVGGVWVWGEYTHTTMIACTWIIHACIQPSHTHAHTNHHQKTASPPGSTPSGK